MGTFQSVFPIKDFNETAILEFVKYELEEPKYDVEECQTRDMTYAAPAQGDAAPDRVRRGRRDLGQVGQGHQGAGRLHGRHAPDDEERHVHRQRHRAGDRVPDAPLARRVLRPRQGQDAFVGQAALRLPHHPLSRLLARLRVRRQGPRVLPHRPQAEAAGDDAALCARHGSGADRQRLLRHRRLHAAQGRGLVHEVLPRALHGHAPGHGHRRRVQRRGRDGGGNQGHAAPGQEAARGGPRGRDPRAVRRDRRQVRRARHHRRDHRRHLRGGRRRADLGARQGGRGVGRHAQGADRRRRPRHPGARHRQRHRRSLHPQHAGGGQEPGPRHRAHGHLPRDASGRAAHRGRGAEPVRPALPRRRALRPFRRGPGEDEHAPRPRRRGHGPHPARRRHPRLHQGAGGAARRARRDRRHRPSRQPPGPVGRRADGEPVPRRPAADGARDQGAHVLGRDRHGDAAGPHQRQARRRRRARVLRLEPALAVHGPDQPALRGDAQAAPLGARAGRADARARGLRGARRAPDPLRPDVPDRDAGRPEHRPHQQRSPPMPASTSTASSRRRTARSSTGR